MPLLRRAFAGFAVSTLALFAVVAVAPNALAVGVAGYGASLAQWVHAHPIDTAHCSIGICYGPLIDSQTVEPEFSFVQTRRGLVVGYDEALKRGTSRLAAELQIVEQLPSDVSLPEGVTVIRRDRYGHSCAVIDLWSNSLAKRFGSKGPAGLGNSIGVELATIGAHGTPIYNPRTVDFAIVVPEYLDASTTC
jgi:hypothetical protein